MFAVVCSAYTRQGSKSDVEYYLRPEIFCSIISKKIRSQIIIADYTSYITIQYTPKYITFRFFRRFEIHVILFALVMVMDRILLKYRVPFEQNTKTAQRTLVTLRL